MDLDLAEVEDLSIGSIPSKSEKGTCERDLPRTLIPHVQVVDHIYHQLDPIQGPRSSLALLAHMGRSHKGDGRRTGGKLAVGKMKRKRRTHLSIFATSSKVTPSLLTGGPP